MEYLMACLAYFARLGYQLEHFPQTDDCRELWQYDGGIDGWLIVVFRGRNAGGSISLFVEITDADGNTNSLTCGEVDWMECMSPEVPKILCRRGYGGTYLDDDLDGYDTAIRAHNALRR